MEIKITIREVVGCLVFVLWLAPLWLMVVDGWRWFLLVSPEYMVDWTADRVLFAGLWLVAGLGVVAWADDAGVI